MSLTKEECEKALDSLRVFSLQNLNANLREVTKSNDVIEQLIKERYENPPLKFEELKTDMWVWDNDYKLYCLIDRIYSFNKFSVHYHFNTMQEFEENRFYRKQVGE